jgi:predicted lipoprotein
MIRKILIGFCSLLITTFFVQCDPKKKVEITPESSFDKVGMLTNIGEKIIVPAYADLKISTDSLFLLNTTFVNTPSLTNLTNLQNQFLKTYIRFQSVSVFDFGPADLELFRANLNTFPSDTAQINSKIATGDYSLSAAEDIDAKGFPALDFLLYGNNHNNANVLARFTTDANAINAKNYLTTLVTEIKNKSNTIYSSWSSSYINTFKNSTGSSLGSSIGMLVNQLCFDLELLKNAKIAIPAGIKTMGVPFPEKTEGVYCTKSLTLAMENLKSIEDIYLGKDIQGADGLGFDNYVAHVGAQHPLGPLNDVIKNKFISAKAKLALIPETLSQSVTSQATLVNAAYLELQQLAVLLKVDMTSALGVMITYQDNDGD